MVGSGGAERRITGGPPWGRRRNVRFIVGNLYRGPPSATEDCAPLQLCLLKISTYNKKRSMIYVPLLLKFMNLFV